MSLTYAGIPSQIPQPVVEIITGNLTLSISGSIYWQLQNRQGYNLYSPPTLINLTTGEGLSVTVPNCNCEGYEPLFYVLSFSPTNSYLNAFVIAKYIGNEELPANLILDKDDYFKTEISVGNVSQLPTNKINGMRIYVDNWGEIREWESVKSSWVKIYPQSFKTLISSTLLVNGCDRPLTDFTEEEKQIILCPEYAVDRSYSSPIKFWIRNDTSTNFFAGRSIIVNVFSNNNDVTDLFFSAGAINLTFLGFVNIEDGLLDTSAIGGGQMSGINQRVTYTNNNSGLILEKDLEPNYAYCVLVELQTDVASLNGRVSENARIEISLSIGERVGYYSGVAEIIGNLISSGLDKRRIVPDIGLSAIALSGSGIVNGRTFIGVGERTVLGLTANQANQIIAINGNGTCIAVSELQNGQAIRAKIGTLNGIGKIVNLNQTIELNNTKQLIINLTHPNAIRSDYNDVIKENIKGEFNATSVVVWVNNLKFIIPIENGSNNQIITLTGNNSETVETIIDSELGLYKPVIDSVTTNNNASTFPSGTYNIKVAYYFENTITTIKHEGIPEIESDLLTYISTKTEEATERMVKLYGIQYALVLG